MLIYTYIHIIIKITYNRKLKNVIGGVVQQLFFGAIKHIFGGITLNFEFVMLLIQYLTFLLACSFRKYLAELLFLLLQHYRPPILTWKD